jgi:hypothetical protein
VRTCCTSRTPAGENFLLYAADAKGRGLRKLTDFARTRVAIYGSSWMHPDELVVGLNNRERAGRGQPAGCWWGRRSSTSMGADQAAMVHADPARAGGWQERGERSENHGVEGRPCPPPARRGRPLSLDCRHAQNGGGVICARRDFPVRPASSGLTPLGRRPLGRPLRCAHLLSLETAPPLTP